MACYQGLRLPASNRELHGTDWEHEMAIKGLRRALAERWFPGAAAY